MAEYPSPELVCEAFFRLVQPDHGVTTKLPPLTVEDATGKPKDNWGAKRLWITPRSYGVGRGHVVPQRSVIVRITVWGKPIDKPRHWGRTITLGQELISYTTDWYTSVNLEMPYAGYYPVEISSMRYVSDTRRVDNDPQGLARVEFDVEISYTIKTSTHATVITDPGPDEPAGDVGDQHMTFTRATPAPVWSINHNLGWYPVVDLFTMDMESMDGSITHLNTNTFIVEFNQPTTGKVVIS